MRALNASENRKVVATDGLEHAGMQLGDPILVPSRGPTNDEGGQPCEQAGVAQMSEVGICLFHVVGILGNLHYQDPADVVGLPRGPDQGAGSRKAPDLQATRSPPGTERDPRLPRSSRAGTSFGVGSRSILHGLPRDARDRAWRERSAGDPLELFDDLAIRTADFTELRQQGGTVEGDEVGAFVNGLKQRRGVRVATEDLRIGPDQFEVDPSNR